MPILLLHDERVREAELVLDKYKISVIDYQSMDVPDDITKADTQDVHGDVLGHLPVCQHFDNDTPSKMRSMGTRCAQRIEIPRTLVERDGVEIGRHICMDPVVGGSRVDMNGVRFSPTKKQVRPGRQLRAADLAPLDRPVIFDPLGHSVTSLISITEKGRD